MDGNTSSNSWIPNYVPLHLPVLTFKNTTIPSTNRQKTFVDYSCDTLYNSWNIHGCRLHVVYLWTQFFARFHVLFDLCEYSRFQRLLFIFLMARSSLLSSLIHLFCSLFRLRYLCFRAILKRLGKYREASISLVLFAQSLVLQGGV